MKAARPFFMPPETAVERFCQETASIGSQPPGSSSHSDFLTCIIILPPEPVYSQPV